MLRKQILLLGNKKCVELPQGSRFSASKTKLARFQCCLLKMFFNNGERTTMADGKEPTTSRSQKWEGNKGKELEARGDGVTHYLFEDRACLWDLAYEDYMNRDRKKVAYGQRNIMIAS